MRGVVLWLEMIVLVIFMVLGGSVAVTTLVYVSTSEPLVYEDKTNKVTTGEIELNIIERDGRDLMAMLLVADEYTPYPGVIQVNNTPRIKLDKNWMAKKNLNIRSYYAPSGNWKFSQLINKKMKSIEFKHEVIGGVPNDYLQIVMN